MREVVRGMLADFPGVRVVAAEKGRGVEETIGLLREAKSADVVLLVIDSLVPSLERAMLIAAVAPLAIELAPATRIGAIDIAPGAESGDIAEAMSFLASAGAVTGQLLSIAARG